MTPILAQWDVYDERGGSYVVLPDGCCDLIYKRVADGRPAWQITDLQTHAEQNIAAPQTQYVGVRFQPGITIDRAALLFHANRFDGFDQQLLESIPEFVAYDRDTADLLAQLATTPDITQTARDAGVSLRTFQRHLLRRTGQGPKFWVMLARVRRAARYLGTPQPLSEITYAAGFADQAHMTREFRRWFGVTPTKMRADQNLLDRIGASGFA